MNDDELRRRLKAHNYAAPPITDSTRHVLTKKLIELDNKQRGTPKKRGGRVGVSRNLEYSSAEEEALSPNQENNNARATSESFGKKGKKSAKKSETSKRTTLSTGHTNGDGFRSPRAGWSVAKTSAPSHRRNGRGNTIDFSDEEELKSDPNRESNEENDEDNGVDDEDNGVDDEDDEDDQFVETYQKPRVDFGVQASFADSPASPDGVSYRSNRRSSEFTSSTPLPSPKSTASYLGENQQLEKGGGNSNFFISPHFRRRIESDQQFGSLGEALSSLSSSSVVTQTTRVYPNQRSTSTAAQGVGSREKALFTARSHWASKLIICLAVFFSLFIIVKYVNLKPIVNIRDHIPICGSRTEASRLHSCFHPFEVQVVEGVFELLKSMARVKSEQHYCQMKTQMEGDQEDRSECEGTSFEELKSKLKQSLPQQRLDENQLSSLIDRLKLLLDDQGERLGMRLRSDGQVELGSPSFVLSCWVQGLFMLLRDWITAMATIFIISATVAIVGYLGKRLYVWRREKMIEEEQEVFELVEKILSLLANQSQRATNQRQWLAINHVRDQLLSPKDRKKKGSIWNRAEHYIRNSESRVREDVQRIFGEEHKSWQWIPNIQWSPTNGLPNPYTPPNNNSSPLATPEPLKSYDSPQMDGKTSSKPSVSPSSSSSPRASLWQGSALSGPGELHSPQQSHGGLGEPPTNCIKVRHLFDDSVKLQGEDWASEVRDEVLRRCRLSQIVHLAVDTESHEGCVYMKCLTKSDAGKANEVLHGQWYRGNLIKVTFMREARYHEKFPQAINHMSPMLPRIRRI